MVFGHGPAAAGSRCRCLSPPIGPATNPGAALIQHIHRNSPLTHLVVDKLRAQTRTGNGRPMSALGQKQACSVHSPLPSLTLLGLLRSWFLDLPHKISLHGRPLGCNNAVDASIPECAVLSYLMATQYTVQFCAQPLYAMTTLVVEKMSPKFNGDTVQCFKCMLEKQKFALCVDLGSLDAFPIPSSANL